jgi:hypothetical protein
MSTEERFRTIHAQEMEANGVHNEEYFMREKYQLGILTDHLKSHGFDHTTEGRIFCYPIDILCVRDDTTVAIEMKSGKISRGVEQAKRNSDFVDFSYLAVWEEQITDSLIETVTDTPVGLFSVAESITQISPPMKTAQQLCSRDTVFSSVGNDVRDNTSVQQSQ